MLSWIKIDQPSCWWPRSLNQVVDVEYLLSHGRQAGREKVGWDGWRNGEKVCQAGLWGKSHLNNNSPQEHQPDPNSTSIHVLVLSPEYEMHNVGWGLVGLFVGQRYIFISWFGLLFKSTHTYGGFYHREIIETRSDLVYIFNVITVYLLSGRRRWLWGHEFSWKFKKFRKIKI